MLSLILLLQRVTLMQFQGARSVEAQDDIGKFKAIPMMQRALERHRTNHELAMQMFTTFQEITHDHTVNLEILMENTQWVHPPSEPPRGGGLRQVVEVLELHQVCPNGVEIDFTH